MYGQEDFVWSRNMFSPFVQCGVNHGLQLQEFMQVPSICLMHLAYSSEIFSTFPYSYCIDTRLSSVRERLFFHWYPDTSHFCWCKPCRSYGRIAALTFTCLWVFYFFKLWISLFTSSLFMIAELMKGQKNTFFRYEFHVHDSIEYSHLWVFGNLQAVVKAWNILQIHEKERAVAHTDPHPFFLDPHFHPSQRTHPYACFTLLSPNFTSTF